jgi:membrane fusion protein (multidrug efflux system)
LLLSSQRNKDVRKSYREYGIGIFLLLVILTFGCQKKEDAEQKAENGLLVPIEELKTMDLDYHLNRVGTLEAKESVTVKSEAEETVVGIFFEEGDAVEAGQLLAKLDDAKIKTTIQQLEARLRQLELQLANSERTLERKQPLVKEDLVSKQDFDDLETKLEIEKATVKEVKAQLAHNRELLKDTEICAPFPGATSERHVSVGDFLRIGDPVVRVVQLDPLEISFRVDEKDKTHVFLDEPVEITVTAYPDSVFKGKVYFVSPDIDISTRTFLVKGRIDNDQNLLNPGMFAEVSLVTETHKNAVVVPWESVVQLENEMYLYVINSDTAKKVPLKLGLVEGELAEVFGELKPGQHVVVEGKYALREGAKVKILEKSRQASNSE